MRNSHGLPNNLGEMRVNNKILHDKVIRQKPTIKSTKFCQPCNIKSSPSCKNLKSTNLFLAIKRKLFNIYHESNYRSKNVIYWFAQADRFIFLFILNNYRHDKKKKTMVYNKLILAEQHFRSNCLGFNKYAIFIIIKRIDPAPRTNSLEK